MALSFTGGTAALSTWGFGAGDVIAMVGAGRAVGTWLMAQHEDRGFLSLLGATPNDILRRKGLIDTVALHQRWDQELTLLKNGRRTRIRHPTVRSAKMVESMDRFTWCMTLMVATLDAALDTRMVLAIIQKIMIKILEDRTDEGSGELLIYGLKKHVEGWRSAACVRGISLEAQTLWKRSLRQGKHLPGNIPESDSSEIERLLVWITTGQDNLMVTTSADVYCLGDILANIGLGDQLKTSYDPRYGCDESQMLLVFDKSAVPVHNILSSYIKKLELRRGMRIPLKSMEECVSVWGGDTIRGNKRRDIFTSGMKASNGVSLVVALKSQTLYAMDEDLLDVYYLVKKDSEAILPRMEKDVYRLLDVFFLASTPGTAAGLRNLVKSWPSDSSNKIGWWLQDLHIDRDTDDELNTLDSATTQILSDFIIFVLGYYYALLKPLLVTTELGEQEAIGSWGYDDIQALRVLRQFKLSADADYEGRFSRHSVLRLLAYMFAGAHFRDQLRDIPERAIGVLGKLSIVTGSLMGQADRPDKVEKFWLLDIDQSCIPSNSRGIVISGTQARCPQIAPRGELSVTCVDFSSIAKPGGDFTSHIEPDWNYDVQRVLVAYRDEGRIVHRISPIDSDIAVITSWVEESDSSTKIIERALPVSLDEYHGGFVVMKPVGSAYDGIQFVAMTYSLPKARTCITAMYGANVGALSSNDLEKAAADISGSLMIIA